MKRILTIGLFLIHLIGYSQGNTFPSSGNVGIGTTGPGFKLDLVSNSANTDRNSLLDSDVFASFQNSNGTAGNLTGLFFLDANRWGVAAILAQNKSHSSHTGTLSFLTRKNGAPTQTQMLIDENGFVGIGNTIPEARLEVASPGFGGSTLIFGGIIGTKNPGHELNLVGGKPTDSWPANQGGHIRLGGNGRGDGDVNVIQFLQNGSEKMRINNGGNVGIGTTQPDQKLTVNGTIHATRVKVDITVPAPDYVFEKSYSLPSLDEVKSYIDENKHLPEVPSAKEMEAKGIDVGEMNMLLLKKMEEMTLYVIELNRQNESMRAEVKALKIEITNLKK